MDIALHWEVARVGFQVKDEKTLSFKNRLGCKPSSLQQSVIIRDMPDKINKAWKQQLNNKINVQFRKDTKAVIFVNGHKFELSARNREDLVNRIANGMLRIQKHPVKEDIHNVSAAGILADCKY